ncbi:MAG: hypothetical protein K9H61_02410 [Bacteroidia bacterium]|nr:hypothetical protein [Bacteroidia bacterium]MCF8427179.1 hypothetical protein [Bacteroidia bacterium]MCF8445824.1 hypothetical protein [Bacteroidia bacterium]
MSSAIENVSYYKEMARKNEQAWLTSKSVTDKEILSKQIETFRKLQLRFQTIAAKQVLAENQLQLF